MVSTFAVSLTVRYPFFYAFPNECTKLLLNDVDHGDFGVINSCQVDVNIE